MRPPGLPSVPEHHTDYGRGYAVRWPADAPNLPGHLRTLQRVAPGAEDFGPQWLRPAVSGVALSALMTWWALLFTLSMVARYEPAGWMAALDYDHSDIAAPLEQLLDTGLARVPGLVYDALTARAVTEDAEGDGGCSSVPDGWLVPGPPQRLEGDDRFTGTNGTVLDLWRWAFSDLRDNYLRGILAEFLVALAVDRTHTRRVSWDNYDLTTGSGARIEVKASGYLQGWAQARLSQLSFGRVAARSWDPNTGQFGAAPEVRADIFVFAVQTCTDHAAYDTLDTDQWKFYVVSGDAVRACGYKTLGIGWVRKQTESVSFERLAATIEELWQAVSSTG